MIRRQKIFIFVIFALFGISFVLLFIPFLTEILMATFFAFALAPVTRRLTQRKLLRRRGIAILTLVSFIVIVTAPFFISLYSFYSVVRGISSVDKLQETSFYKDLTNLKNLITATVERIGSSAGLEKYLNFHISSDQLLSRIATEFLDLSSRIASSVPDLLLSFFVFFSLFYIFLAESRKIRTLFVRSRLLPIHHIDQMVEILQKTCSTTLVASVLVGLSQAAVLAGATLIFGVGDPFVVFIITFFLSFIPVLGTTPVALFLTLLCVIDQSYSQALGFVIAAVIAGSIDNILRPFLVGESEEIHPLLMLIAIIGAVIIFGLPGLFVGPVIVSVTTQIYRIYWLGESATPKITDVIK